MHKYKAYKGWMFYRSQFIEYKAIALQWSEYTLLVHCCNNHPLVDFEFERSFVKANHQFHGYISNFLNSIN